MSDKYSMFVVFRNRKVVGFYHSLETAARKRRGCTAVKITFEFNWNGLQDVEIEKLIL
ncbi:MAG: hypothetical protein IJO46_14350 [Thermoguttaceae bacterium]|nr:hypothetical protein [Thermoguttaceae bacterium]MBQ7109957.1 hypothetical protein [Thermoguttaceae bacterium]